MRFVKLTVSGPAALDALRSARPETVIRRARILVDGRAVVIQRGRDYCARVVVPAATVSNLLGN